MRGKVAKKIRKLIYGDDKSPRARKYYKDRNTYSVISDETHQKYQKAKSAYTRGLITI